MDPIQPLGQANPGPPPPAHLPRFIWECEIGAGASAEACGVWSWQGASYSATWSIGAMGQLTVTSGERAEISVHRQDTSGNLAGLDATYTAKWDGSRFSGWTTGKNNPVFVMALSSEPMKVRLTRSANAAATH